MVFPVDEYALCCGQQNQIQTHSECHLASSGAAEAFLRGGPQRQPLGDRQRQQLRSGNDGCSAQRGERFMSTSHFMRGQEHSIPPANPENLVVQDKNATRRKTKTTKNPPRTTRVGFKTAPTETACDRTAPTSASVYAAPHPDARA